MSFIRNIFSRFRRRRSRRFSTGEAEAAAASYSPATILKWSETNSFEGLALALSGLLLQQASYIPSSIRENLNARCLFYKANPDVLLFETSAFLLGSLDYLIEEMMDSGELQEMNYTELAVYTGRLLSEVVEDFAHFPNTSQLVTKHSTAYFCESSKSRHRFVQTLVGCKELLSLSVRLPGDKEAWDADHALIEMLIVAPFCNTHLEGVMQLACAFLKANANVIRT